MKIVSLKTINGPNVYHHEPILLMKVDLEHLTDTSSADILGFTSRLLAALPGLEEHGCSLRKKGGFITRLERGTYPAHIIEHIALELSSLADIETKFGKTRYAGTYGLYEIAVTFKNELGMKECLKSAFNLFQQLLHETPIDVSHYLHKIRHAVAETSLGISTQSLIDAARKRNIPYQKIGNGSLFQLGYGKQRKLIQAAVTSETNLIGADIAQDKALTKEILHQAFIPIPRGFVVNNMEDLEIAKDQLNPPFAIKPLDGHHGLGVSLNLKILPEIHEAFLTAQKYCPDVLIEEMIFGEDYRLLVIDGKLKAAAHRVPAYVVGDGQHTLHELIEITNNDPLRGEGHSTYLSEIVVDDVLVRYLQQQGLDLTSIPEIDHKVQLRGNANLSTGGTAEDVTKLVHPDIKAMAERIARIVNLNICGIDIICEDIAKAPTANFAVIEVNAGPGLRMHMLKDDPHQIGDAILDSLYPTREPSRIPIISVTGTNGKTTIVRLLKHILEQNEQKCIGMTTTEGVWIQDHLIYKGDCAGPQSSQVLLRDPLVDCAVLEVARGGILKGGLGYDWSDVSIISNITADHIGQDGIENLDDLIWVKSLVAERVKPHGTLILNANNPAALSLRYRDNVTKHPKKIVLYALEQNASIHEHLMSGGTAFWYHQGWLMRGQGREVYAIANVSDIPLTYNGSLTLNISNVLAACAGAVALQVPLTQIIEGLKTFHPSLQNPGRMNIYKVAGAHVIVDYGHNEEALHQVGKFVQQFPFVKRSLVVGLPGDRGTDLLQETSRIIPNYFDQIYLRDEADLRGRAPMEVPTLMAAQIPPHVPHKIMTSEVEALQLALSQLEPNSVLVILYEQANVVYSVLNEYDPQPVSSLEVRSLQTQPSVFSQMEVR